ncbi:hypothetical protein MK280_00135, partial [Myxococcota bacterium]|nr:hypothetical protein [Myxococcota bacterium]
VLLSVVLWAATGPLCGSRGKPRWFPLLILAGFVMTVVWLNLLANEVVALIDLDTVARRPLYFDLGDAWRSWCNRRTEDAQEAQLDVSIYAAAAEGYRAALGFTLSADEWRSLEVAFEWVTLELCARYATDTLEENYFAWDAEQYASAAEHNWARANGQWNLYQQALDTATVRLESLRD